MITISTNKLIDIRNTTYEIIDSKIVSLSIQKIEQNSLGVIATGFYHYTNDEGIVVKLKDNRTYLSWDDVQGVELGMLQPMTNINYKEANFQRLREFTILRLTQESGQNFGINIEDWDLS
jgi:hypothetical protein